LANKQPVSLRRFLVLSIDAAGTNLTFAANAAPMRSSKTNQQKSWLVFEQAGCYNISGKTSK
jgi:hypothetical protein